MKVLSLLLAMAAIPTMALADGWTTSYSRAVSEARAGHKPILMYFTGSDFCVWCKKLDRDVLEQPAFQQYADRNLVLLKLDFPARKRQNPRERQQNEELRMRYGVQGFPTLILVEPGSRTAVEITGRRNPRSVIGEIERKGQRVRR